MLGVNLSQLNGAWLYEAKPYEPVTVELKKAKQYGLATIWTITQVSAITSRHRYLENYH